MKVWHVYVLVNSNGIVEYVGETINPKQRLRNHTKKKAGKFYGRTDISMHVVKLCDNKKTAFNAQCLLQNNYGLQSDSEIMSDAQKGRTISEETKQKLSDAHIGRTYKPMSLETKLKMSLAQKGRTISEETKLKMSESRKGRLAWNKGKSHSEEVKEKIKKSLLKYFETKNI